MGREEFRGDLLEAGILFDAGVEGLYHHSFFFESLVRGIEGLIVRSANTPHHRRFYFPPVMARTTLVATGYVRSFPNLIGSISSFTGGDRELRELSAALDTGVEWTELFSPIDLVTCSAACHSLYPLLSDQTPLEQGDIYEIQGTCFRHEPSLDVARMQSFRQHELVYVGDAVGALRQRDSWLEFGQGLLSNLGLEVTVDEANDPFFGRTGRMLASGQRDKKLKFEISCAISSDLPGAIASGNYHEDHFGASFNIRRRNDQPAHSACFGFGLERIALALIQAHGQSFDEWPTSVTDQLQLAS
jgi:seryl-tRNA synthetase